MKKLLCVCNILFVCCFLGSTQIHADDSSDSIDGEFISFDDIETTTSSSSAGASEESSSQQMKLYLDFNQILLSNEAILFTFQDGVFQTQALFNDSQGLYTYPNLCTPIAAKWTCYNGHRKQHGKTCLECGASKEFTQDLKRHGYEIDR